MSEDGRDSVTLNLRKFSHFDRTCIRFLGMIICWQLKSSKRAAIETHECKAKCYEEYFAEGSEEEKTVT